MSTSGGDGWNQLSDQHRVEKSQLIAGAALTLLLEQGASGLTMAQIATAAGISRQTLYRYFADIDAVLVAIVELLGAHDDALAQQVRQQRDPQAQLDELVSMIVAADHGDASVRAVIPLLPAAARDALVVHEQRTTELMTTILEAGKTSGAFRADIQPTQDAPLLLGLLGAASIDGAARAVDLVHQIVYGDPA